MSIEYQPIIEIKQSDFDFDLFYKNQPVVIRGLVDDWPLVKASSSSMKILISHILCYYEGDRVISICKQLRSLVINLHMANTETKKSFLKLERTLRSYY